MSYILPVFSFFFFFSSRRRHTRSLCDWSSDVCSSDLREGEGRHRDEPEITAGQDPAKGDGPRRSRALLRLGRLPVEKPRDHGEQGHDGGGENDGATPADPPRERTHEQGAEGAAERQPPPPETRP